MYNGKNVLVALSDNSVLDVVIEMYMAKYMLSPALPI